MASVTPHGSEAQISPAAQITIRRTSPDDVQLRQIVVKLDGKRVVDELMYGDTVTIPVTPGRHRLRVDNTWNWKTLDLDVAPGDHPKFLTINRAGRFTWFLVGTLGAGPMYVSIQPDL
ncbi:MAG: hypothetical protein JWO71_3637 [Candidatus Acidoferrum typicum]|nr:hypothetical protein [Candidatus Acidoferrum typicum]